MLALLGQHFFYCTGHTSQFAGLQYNAGFVGFDDFNYLRAGALLAANTFGPHLMSTLLVRPLPPNRRLPADQPGVPLDTNSKHVSENMSPCYMSYANHSLACLLTHAVPTLTRTSHAPASLQAPYSPLSRSPTGA